MTWILVAALLTAPLATWAGNRNRPRSRCSIAGSIQNLPVEELQGKEARILLHMREEEKLARDVYLTLYEHWNLRAFQQIAGAEKQHMVAVGKLIDKYDLEDPIGDNALGVFTDPELQALYQELSAAGAHSLLNALEVGAAIEEMDIYDLQVGLRKTDNEDIRLVYQNLMKGSRNHLRSFAKLLERHGASYQPVYLTIDEYLEIIESPKEKGVVDADGDLLCGDDSR